MHTTELATLVTQINAVSEAATNLAIPVFSSDGGYLMRRELSSLIRETRARLHELEVTNNYHLE